MCVPCGVAQDQSFLGRFSVVLVLFLSFLKDFVAFEVLYRKIRRLFLLIVKQRKS